MSTPTQVPNLDTELRSDEGERRVPYKDTKGRWACGVGCDLKAHGLVGEDGRPLSMIPWTPSKVDHYLSKDILTACQLVHDHLTWSYQLDAVRCRVLVNMMFNMGWGDGEHGLSSFKNTLKAFQEGRWKDAAQGILNSKFGRVDGPARAQRLAYRTETGLYWLPANYYPKPNKAA